MSDLWWLSCIFNWASCRQRAETLTRRWQSSAWSESPCFWFRSPVGWPSISADRTYAYRMADDGDGMTSHVVISAPTYSSSLEMLSSHLKDLHGNAKLETNTWMPESPPESPPMTIMTKADQNSSHVVEPLSDVASSSFEVRSDLANELCSKLRMFESLQINDISNPKSQTSNASRTSSNLSNFDSNLLIPEPTPRLVRSTSLKSGKTPPDTPTRKKFVKFADALGLDLESVRHFLDDEDASIPQSAYADLKLVSKKVKPTQPWFVPVALIPSYRFEPEFSQPSCDPHFMNRVRSQKLSLENTIVNDLTVTAIVRVLNLGFEKQLTVRYTTTEWAAFTDLNADYVPQSCDGFSDKFQFRIELPHLCISQRLMFALKYVVNGQEEFWDNNYGSNYVLRVQNKESDESNGMNLTNTRWIHHFV